MQLICMLEMLGCQRQLHQASTVMERVAVLPGSTEHMVATFSDGHASGRYSSCLQLLSAGFTALPWFLTQLVVTK